MSILYSAFTRGSRIRTDVVIDYYAPTVSIAFNELPSKDYFLQGDDAKEFIREVEERIDKAPMDCIQRIVIEYARDTYYQ